MYPDQKLTLDYRMNALDSCSTPKKVINSELYFFEEGGRYIISSGKNYFAVNANTLKVIHSLRGNNSIDTAYGDYCNRKGESLSIGEFTELSENIIQKINSKILLSKSYLNLRIRIISASIAGRIGQMFSFLFNEKTFLPLFISGCLLNITNLVIVLQTVTPLLKNLTNTSLIPLIDKSPYLLLLVLTPFLHETGHISACRRFKAKHGGIGMGFYFIIPVFYSDITGVWMISKDKRTIVNLAGIYFELIFTLVLLVLAVILSNPALSVVCALVFINNLRQLNPLLRYDGYWILCDQLKVPNLRKNARKAIMLLVLEALKGKRSSIDLKLVFLAIFGITGYVFLFLFIFTFFRSFTREILHYPVTLYKVLYGIVLGGDFLKSINPGVFAMASLFYFLLLRFIWKKYGKGIIRSGMRYLLNKKPPL